MINFIVTIAVFCAGWIGAAQAASNTTVFQLDSTPSQLGMESIDPIAVGSSIYAAYATSPRVVFMVSQDAGVTFTSQYLDDGNESASGSAFICVGGGNIYAIWSAFENSKLTILARVSTDSGLTFGAETPLGNGIFPVVACDGLGVSVTFENSVNRQTEVVSSSDGGVTWPADSLLSLDGFGQEQSMIRVGDTIKVAWEQWSADKKTRVIELGESSDDGATFMITPITAGVSSSREPLLAYNGTWYLLYRDDSDQNVKRGYLRLLTSFTGPPQTIATDARQGSILVNGQTLTVSWLQHGAAGWHVTMSYSLDGGVTWSSNGDLSGSIGATTPLLDNAYLPSMSWSGNTFVLAYSSRGKVVVRTSSDLTLGLSKPIFLGTGNFIMLGGNTLLWQDPNRFLYMGILGF